MRSGGVAPFRAHVQLSRNVGILAAQVAPFQTHIQGPSMPKGLFAHADPRCPPALLAAFWQFQTAILAEALFLPVKSMARLPERGCGRCGAEYNTFTMTWAASPIPGVRACSLALAYPKGSENTWLSKRPSTFGRTVSWCRGLRPRPMFYPFAALRIRCLRGHSLLPQRRNGQKLRVPPEGPHGPSCPQHEDRGHSVRADL